MNYYEILEVSLSATQEIIKIAYKNLAKKCHPDIVGTEMANKKMQELNEAYEILSDPEKRKEYDANFLSDYENYSFDCEEATNEYKYTASSFTKVVDKFKEDFVTVLIAVGTTTFCYMKGWNNWFVKLWYLFAIGWFFMFICEIVDLITENSFTKKILKCLAFGVGAFAWFELTR